VGAATIAIAVLMGRAPAVAAGIGVTATDALGMTWWLVASSPGLLLLSP
jgi:hypothetical protein